MTKIKYHDIVQLRNKISHNKIYKKIYFFKFCENVPERFKIKGENVMRITELLRKSSIALQVDVQSKEETIDYLVDLMSQSGIIPDKEEYKQGILLRESLGTTAIGDEIAIPLAAKDPLRVIPSCIIGSATAGGLSMAFNCTLRAPHGGIFVLPTIGNPLMYALAIFIGALVGCLVLSFLKKPLPENVEEKKGNL